MIWIFLTLSSSNVTVTSYQDILEEFQSLSMHWKRSITKWVSSHIEKNTHIGFLIEKSTLYFQSKNIHKICFDITNPYEVNGNTRKALCGSLKTRFIKNNGLYEWQFLVPHNLCTVIQVVELPGIDSIFKHFF